MQKWVGIPRNREAKEAALTAILAAGSKDRHWTFLEAFRRFDGVTLAARPDLVALVQAAILESKGTITFVDLVAKYDRRDLVEDLLDMVRTDPGNPPAIRALQQLLAFGEQQRVTEALAKPDQSTALIDALGLLSPHLQQSCVGPCEPGPSLGSCSGLASASTHA